jgi:exonuclease III
MADFKNIKITSFNCKNVKSSVPEILELCIDNDIVLLQETWLADFEISFLTQISEDFYATGISAMDTNISICKGRPFGGLAILWRKALADNVRIVKYDDTRIMGIELYVDNKKFLFLNVYLPYDNGENLDEFLFYMYKINDIFINYESPYVMALGDFNANIEGFYNKKVYHRFGRELISFCTEENLIISDTIHCSVDDTYTFYSEAHHSTSWLDHIIANVNMHALINNVKVDYKCVTSDHFPVCCSINTGGVGSVLREDEVSDEESQGDFHNIKWECLNKAQISSYTKLTGERFSKVKLPHELFACKNPHCNDSNHINDINVLYKNIVDVLSESSLILNTTKSKSKCYNVPGWNELCKQAHCEAREAFLLWRVNGSQKHGPIFQIMNRTRAVFKSLFRKCNKDKQQYMSDMLAKKYLCKETTVFWKAVNKINPSRSTAASTINGVTGKNKIVEVWQHHYKELLNSNGNILERTYNLEGISLLKDNIITASQAEEAIHELKCGKSPGLDGIYAEHFKYSDRKIMVLLALFFNS